MHLLLGGVFGAGQNSAMPQSPTSEHLSIENPKGGPDPVFWVGVGTHLGKQIEGYGDGITLQRVEEAGATSIRDEIYWDQVERKKGELQMPAYAEAFVTQCVERGIEPLIILGYGNPHYDEGGYPLSPEAREGYIRYATFLAEHFKGRVRLFEIWNEWDMGLGIPRPEPSDGGRFRGDPGEYVDLVAAVAPEIRKVNPEAIVLAGGHAMFSLHSGKPDLKSQNPWEAMRGWFDEALEAGLLKHCDALSLHTYTKSTEDPETWADWMVGLADRYTETYSGGKEVPIYITETGWFTHSKAGIDHQVQADYVARLYLLARTIPSIQGLWYFNLENDVFGLSHGAGSPRAAYWAWRDIADLVSHATCLGRMDVGDPDVWMLRFLMPDGEEVWAAWTRTKRGFYDRRYNSPVTGYVNLHLRSEAESPSALDVTMVGMGKFTQPWGLRTGRFGETDPQRTILTLGPRPQLIRGQLPMVAVTGKEKSQQPKGDPAALQDEEGANQGLGVE